ncbi:uncharacterized protein [Macrobrachium rosenbergii]|uniref:uncharacterized protein n=1 Tax=Macrobrachium rosenbergii TaxID=79674 RepID=UPI0034D51DA0
MQRQLASLLAAKEKQPRGRRKDLSLPVKRSKRSPSPSLRLSLSPAASRSHPHRSADHQLSLPRRDSLVDQDAPLAARLAASKSSRQDALLASPPASRSRFDVRQDAHQDASFSRSLHDALQDSRQEARRLARRDSRQDARQLVRQDALQDARLLSKQDARQDAHQDARQDARQDAPQDAHQDARQDAPVRVVPEFSAASSHEKRSLGRIGPKGLCFSLAPEDSPVAPVEEADLSQESDSAEQEPPLSSFSDYRILASMLKELFPDKFQPSAPLSPPSQLAS